MKWTTTNVMLGILIAASLVTSYKLHQVVNRYDEMKVQVTEVVGEVEVKINDFNKVLEAFTLEYGDEIAEDLKEEGAAIIIDAQLYADSLRVKAGARIDSIMRTRLGGQYIIKTKE
jgi:hypothetical protein